MKPFHYVVGAFLGGVALATVAFLALGSDDDPEEDSSRAATITPVARTSQSTPSPVPTITPTPGDDSQAARVTVTASAPTQDPAATATSVPVSVPTQPPLVSAPEVAANVRLTLRTCFDNLALTYALYYAFPWTTAGPEMLDQNAALITIATPSGVLDVSAAVQDPSAARQHLLDARYPDGFLLEALYVDSDAATFAGWLQQRVATETGIVVEPKASAGCPGPDSLAVMAQVEYLSDSVNPPSLPPTTVPVNQAINIQALPQRSYVSPDGQVNALHDFVLSEPFSGDTSTGIEVAGLPKASSNGLQSWEVSPNGLTITVVIGNGAAPGSYQFVVTFSDGRTGSVQFDHN